MLSGMDLAGAGNSDGLNEAATGTDETGSDVRNGANTSVSGAF